MESDLPDAEALLVRDCLIHLDFDAIGQVLRNVARSRVRWLLVSEYPDLRKNVDTSVGPAAPVSLSLPPFSLGEKTAEITDAELTNGRKTLAVWDSEAVRDFARRSEVRARKRRLRREASVDERPRSE